MLSHSDQATEFLVANSSVVVNYFEALSKLCPKQIGEAFDGDLFTGRVFIEINSELVKSLDPFEVLKNQQILDDLALLENEKILNAFGEKFLAWTKMTDDESISNSHQIVNFFFEPIETSEAWKNFWEKECERIQAHCEENAKDFATEQKRIRDLIASSLLYKLQSLWSKERIKSIQTIEKEDGLTEIEIKEIKKQQQQQIIQLSEKVKLFSGLTNTMSNHQEAMSLKESILKGSIEKTLLSIQGMIIKEEIEIDKISNRITQYIAQWRQDDYFKVSKNSEKILHECLWNFTSNLALQIAPSARMGANKAVKAIFRDITAHHFGSFTSETPPEKYLMRAIEINLAYASKQTKKDNDKLLRQYNKHALKETKENLILYTDEKTNNDELSHSHHDNIPVLTSHSNNHVKNKNNKERLTAHPGLFSSQNKATSKRAKSDLDPNAAAEGIKNTDHKRLKRSSLKSSGTRHHNTGLFQTATHAKENTREKTSSHTAGNVTRKETPSHRRRSAHSRTPH
ncbi:MAG: hypothetical protein JO149_08390 [Gammaproteobacteria bacterium]|nr:hypothetical protein [Gammaproteobacteria bacterium]